MGKKRKTKHLAKYCLFCGKLLSWELKVIRRIRQEKIHSCYNSVVICSDCNSYVNKACLKIYEVAITEAVANKYFSIFGDKDKFAILKKFKVLRKLNNLKVKFISDFD